MPRGKEFRNPKGARLMQLTKQWFITRINEFLKNDPSNKMSLIDNSLMFMPDVLVGFASGNDTIFESYKHIIGDFHLTPSEAFSWYSKRYEISYAAENLSIVAFILPINIETKKENLEYSKQMPSIKWANTRLFGEETNVNVQKMLVDELKRLKINAMAPAIENRLFKIDRKIWASNWSHRHYAFAAGLGSFGLSDGFINARGKAMRCGSIIVDYKLPSDAENRPHDPYHYCTNCGDCISRCPVGAITLENRHDKIKCSERVMKTIPYIK
jgi:epoxyqueuosine reductase